MEETRAAATAPDDEIHLLDIALVLAENLRLLILVPLAAGLLALGISFAIPPTFTATTQILPPQQQQSLATALASQLGALAGPATAAAGIKNPADIYVAMLKSRTVADRLIERFGLKQVYDVKSGEQARKELASRSSIAAGRDGLIAVNVDDEDPKRAADLANGYVEALLALTQSLAVTEAGQRRVFFERQLRQARDELTRAEIALRGAGINQATLNTIPEAALDFVAQLKAKVTAQEVNVAALRGFMTEANPQFTQAQTELAALRAQLAKAERNDNSKALGQGTEYTERLRDFKYHQALFELISKQYELARIDEARDGAIIQVVDAAVVPERKSRPRRALITVLTTLITGMLVVVGVFVARAWRDAKATDAGAARIAAIEAAFGRRRA